MTKIIWVDLDEVLVEFVDYALFFHDYKIAWKEIKRENIRDYYLHKIVEFDIDVNQAIDWFRKAMFNDNDKLEIKPLDWAIEWLNKLKNKWYILKIVTARQADLFWEYTKKWVEKHYPDFFEEIIFANHFSKKEKTKAELCKENSILYMIEDNPDYALELANNWIITYLLEKPWNRQKCINHKNIICVKSWSEINF